MPIEMLVPIAMYVIGISVAIKAAGLGIERIVEAGKRK